MKKTVTYPDWVEKYRGEGRTIRKTKNGYALYECTSVYVKGLNYPKSVQKYLGRITENDGFIPNKFLIPITSLNLVYPISLFQILSVSCFGALMIIHLIMWFSVLFISFLMM